MVGIFLIIPTCIQEIYIDFTYVYDIYIYCKLYTGKRTPVTFDILGYPQMHFGTIASFCADNLAGNALDGFKEGSTALGGCRQCFATPKHMSSMVS